MNSRESRPHLPAARLDLTGVWLRGVAALGFLAALAWATSQLTAVSLGRYSLQALLAVLAIVAGILYALLWMALRRRARALNAARALLLGLLIGFLAGELLLRRSGRFNTYFEAQGRAVTYSIHRPPAPANPGGRGVWSWLRRAAGHLEHAQPLPIEPWLFTGTPGTVHLEANGEFEFLHEYNSLGLRDEEPAFDKPAGEYRIVGLGDSFTEGNGADQDSTWLKSLERQLNADDGGAIVRTLNGGKAGSDPFFEYMLLERRLLDWQPDLVIVAVNNSDLEDVRIRGGTERFRPDGTVAYRPAPAWEPLYGLSHVVRAVVHGPLDYDWGLLRSHERAAAVVRSTDLLLEGLITFEKLSRERGFALVVVLHPLQWDLEGESWPLEPLALRLRSETDIRVVNLYEYYKGPDGIPPDRVSDYYWPIDLHHNTRGYDLFARGLAEALARWRLDGRTAASDPASPR